MSNLSQCLHAFFAEYLNFGVKHVVVCPGSRNFPLIKTVVNANKFVKLHSVVDERSAGFVALGLAQQTQTPVVVCCTSGTASLNLYPAIAEAFYSRTPLIALTADRPAESIDNWEGQCIRQDGVFDKHIMASFTTPEILEATVEFQNIAQLSVSSALEKCGPVHVNMPFSEPFYSNWVNTPFDIEKVERPLFTYQSIPVQLIEDIKTARRILWLNGASFAKSAFQYPSNLTVWSDVISNKNQTHDQWESIVNEAEVIGLSTPDLLISTGKYCVSKKLRSYLKSADDLTHWHITSEKKVPSPFGTKPKLIHCHTEDVLPVIEQNYTHTEFNNDLKSLEELVHSSLNQLNWKDWTEMTAVKHLYASLPVGAILHIANSMPVRYVGLMPRRTDVYHVSNRGTSGIDGCTSTAIGCAKATNEKVVLFTGDIAFLYDINALWQEELPENLLIIVFNNLGGGIFEIIDGPKKHEDSLNFQTTPHNRSISELASHFGLEYDAISSVEQLLEVKDRVYRLNKLSILEVKTERAANNTFYNSYKNAVVNAHSHER